METIKKTYVLYKHTRKSDDGIFYIGIGSIDRAYDSWNRGKWWKGIRKQYGVNVKILVENLTLEEACNLEILMIAFYGRKKPYHKNLNYGCLINLTDGGEGGNGVNLSEEQKQTRRDKWTDELKQKQSELISGENNPMYKRNFFDIWSEKYDEETFNKMRENYLQDKKNYMFENNPHNDPEVKNKISQSLKGKPKSKEHRKNIAISKIGVKHSEEQNQRQSIIATGSGNSNSKLTEDDVIWIRENYKRYDKVFGMTSLSKKFGVSICTIDFLLSRKTWKHI